MVVETLDFQQAGKALIRSDKLVVGGEDKEYVKNVEIVFNDLSGDIEQFKFNPVSDFVIPLGSVAYPQWRSILHYNKGINILDSAFKTYLTPVASFFLGNDVGKTFIDNMAYVLFTTKIKYLVLGVPEAQNPVIKRRLQAQAGGSPYPKFHRDGYLNLLQDPYGFDASDEGIFIPGKTDNDIPDGYIETSGGILIREDQSTKKRKKKYIKDNVGGKRDYPEVMDEHMQIYQLNDGRFIDTHGNIYKTSKENLDGKNEDVYEMHPQLNELKNNLYAGNLKDITEQLKKSYRN